MSVETIAVFYPGLYQYKDGSPAYRIGSLAYTQRQLTSLFLWLLGGDFAFTFFEQIFGRFLPIFAKDQGASDTLVGVMTGSIAGLVNLFFLPGISTRSDHHRGPLGGRIPFLLLSTPCTVASLLLVGFATEIRALDIRVAARDRSGQRTGNRPRPAVPVHGVLPLLEHGAQRGLRLAGPRRGAGGDHRAFPVVIPRGERAVVVLVFMVRVPARPRPSAGSLRGGRRALHADLFAHVPAGVQESEYPPPAPTKRLSSCTC